ncbi:uncharacterized protein C8A04DRAFT_27397 [Dichotomopilus funicola]|uniref:Uncharacterized protein n=1 Tax=Dichotomopilus funicola TaxID=1934379 RepID=A0AAN6V6F5_9PEZI|nr:hypothetical protein C8A04DRAFT_27397 [Dichotomopilus funicola]
MAPVGYRTFLIALLQAWYVVGSPQGVTPTSSTTPTLPPSPTGSLCSPHGDHWHCERHPSSTQSSSSPFNDPTQKCHAHGDHWHCPDGVPEPTTPPPSTINTATTTMTTTTSASATECHAHGDHWHCPEGVPEPTSPPEQVESGTATTTTTAGPTATGGVGRVGGGGVSAAWIGLVVGLGVVVWV